MEPHPVGCHSAQFSIPYTESLPLSRGGSQSGSALNLPALAEVASNGSPAAMLPSPSSSTLSEDLEAGQRVTRHDLQCASAAPGCLPSH